jgi:adenylate cyclase, class 2
MKNIEFKAELRDIDLARSICRATGATTVASVEQTDTYYKVTQGRLKKREVPDEPTEWIAYDRPDRSQAKASTFTIYTEEEAAARFGTAPLPVWVVVRKRRDVFMWRNVRIHLDQVEGLGTFLEFEALVSRKDPVPRCHEALNELRAALAPVIGEPIACSYSDLLASDAERP